MFYFRRLSIDVDAGIQQHVGYVKAMVIVIAGMVGEDHAIVIELGWRFAQGQYLFHFFGLDSYRHDLISSIKGHYKTLLKSSRVLGNHHPTTQAIAASLKLCFDEQLDWTLDDDIRKWLYVHRVLDGNFPPDRADFLRLSDYDADENMNLVIEFLQRLNVQVFF